MVRVRAQLTTRGVDRAQLPGFDRADDATRVNRAIRPKGEADGRVEIDLLRGACQGDELTPDLVQRKMGYAPCCSGPTGRAPNVRMARCPRSALPARPSRSSAWNREPKLHPWRQSEVDPHEGPTPRLVENRGHLVAFPEGRSHRTEGRAATSARTAQSHRGGSLSQGRGRARRLGLRGSRTKLLGSGSASAEPTTCLVDTIFESMPQALKRGRTPHGRRHHCLGRTQGPSPCPSSWQRCSGPRGNASMGEFGGGPARLP